MRGYVMMKDADHIIWNNQLYSNKIIDITKQQV